MACKFTRSDQSPYRFGNALGGAYTCERDVRQAFPGFRHTQMMVSVPNWLDRWSAFAKSLVLHYEGLDRELERDIGRRKPIVPSAEGTVLLAYAEAYRANSHSVRQAFASLCNFLRIAFRPFLEMVSSPCLRKFPRSYVPLVARGSVSRYLFVGCDRKHRKV